MNFVLSFNSQNNVKNNYSLVTFSNFCWHLCKFHVYASKDYNLSVYLVFVYYEKVFD